jgi:hypothetical protein
MDIIVIIMTEFFSSFVDLMKLEQVALEKKS